MQKRLKVLVFLSFIIVATTSGVEREEKKVSEKRSFSEMMEQPKKKAKSKVSKPEKVYFDEDDVELKAGKGSVETGGGKGGHFWWIYATDSSQEEKKAGKVYINLTDEDPVGEHASIQIFLNKSSQGKHIGRWAYKKACEESAYDVVYAHIRKSNVASVKSAEAAGFVKCFPKAPQLIMKWVRTIKK